MKHKSSMIRRIVVSLLVGLAFFLLVMSGILDTPAGFLNDALYNRRSSTDGEVVVIGMDEAALDVLGPMPWPRDIMADVIAILNDDESQKPAVIGVDVLYVGEGSDPAADEAIVKAAEDGGNVVMAASGAFGATLEIGEDESFRMNEKTVTAFDPPFGALHEVVEIGHVNAMPDGDGVIRHALLSVDDPEPGETVYAFGRKVYEKYAAFHGITPTPLPETSDEGFFYLPYTASPGDYYDGVSVIDVLSGNVEPDYYAGKIVLIGPYAVGMQDQYTATIDKAVPMYGIEIQANLADAFRRGFYPAEAERLLSAILVFVLAALLFFFLYERNIYPALGCFLGVSIAWVIFCILACRAGVLHEVLYVPLAAALIFIATVAINYVRAQKEKRRVTATFGRYVDPAILKELLRDGSRAGDLGGATYTIAVLFGASAEGDLLIAPNPLIAPAPEGAAEIAENVEAGEKPEGVSLSGLLFPSEGKALVTDIGRKVIAELSLTDGSYAVYAGVPLKKYEEGGYADGKCDEAYFAEPWAIRPSSWATPYRMPPWVWCAM